MGGGSSKSKTSDSSAELYAVQQADLARQKAETAAAEQAALAEEQARRDELRAQMLGQRNVLSSDAEATVQKSVLG